MAPERPARSTGPTTSAPHGGPCAGDPGRSAVGGWSIDTDPAPRSRSRGCTRQHSCPHLGFRACDEVLEESERLRQENDQLRAVFRTATGAFADKDREIARLNNENDVLRRKLNDVLTKPFTLHTETGAEQEGANTAESQTIPAGGASSKLAEPSTGTRDAPQRKKKRGAPKGHRGATRKKPERKPDRIVVTRPGPCPRCNSAENVHECSDCEEHLVEDLVIVRPVSILYRRVRGWCSDCDHVFTTRAPEDLPKVYIGPVARALAGYLHYVAKVPWEAIRNVFTGVFGLPITPAALIGFDRKLAETGRPLYDEIGKWVRYSTSVNVDETTWPVGNVLEWLWTFVTKFAVFFRIDPTRSGDVPIDTLGEQYNGVLGTDCYGAYNRVNAKAKQKCLAHYQRDADKLIRYYPEDYAAVCFAESLLDLFRRAREAKRQWLKDAFADLPERVRSQTGEQAGSKAVVFEKELDRLCAESFRNRDAENLRARLVKHRDENFTFLQYREVDPDNNRAERSIRPSVTMRKVSYGNTADSGAENHQILMTATETAKIQGVDLLDVFNALALRFPPDTLKQTVFAHFGLPDPPEQTERSPP